MGNVSTIWDKYIDVSYLPFTFVYRFVAIKTKRKDRNDVPL